MRHKLKAGFVLVVAVFALGAVAASAASAALPEFVKAKTGKFSTMYSGNYSSVGWIWNKTLTYTCGSGTVSGEITGAKTMTATITFTGCRNGSGVNCPTEEGAPEGTLKTQPLEGTLVYLSKTAKTVGVDFKPQTGTTVTTFRCVGGIGKIVGSMVTPLTPVNSLGTGFTLKQEGKSEEYEVENSKGGFNKEFANLQIEWKKLESFAWDFGSIAVTTASQVEVKA